MAYCRVRDTECSSACMGPSEGGHHYLHYLHYSLVSGQKTGREHRPCPSIENWITDLLGMAHPSEQDPVSPSVNFSHQKVSISLLSISFRGQTERKPQSQKTNQTDHMDHSSIQFTQSCPTLCNPMDCSTPGFPVHYQLLEFAQTYVHRVSNAIRPSHLLSSPSPPTTFNLSQHQGLFQ